MTRPLCTFLLIGVACVSLPAIAQSSTSTITATYSSTGVISAQISATWDMSCESGSPGWIGTGNIDGQTFSGAVLFGGGGFDFSGGTFGPGTYPVSGTFSGFSGFEGGSQGDPCTIGGSSAGTNVTVLPPITIRASLSSSPVRSGQVVTLVASVGGLYAGPFPTGDVAILYGSRVIATGTLQNSSTGISGTASFPVSTAGIPAGNYEVGLIYGGDDNYASSSGSGQVSISPAVVSTTTSLAVNPTSTTAGQQITLSASVASSGAAAPTGLVTFKSGGLSLGSVELNSSAAGSLTLSSAGIAPGTYPVVASYGGDANNLPSTSPSTNVTLQAATATTLQITPTSPSSGQSINLVATVARLQSAGFPAGTVSFSLDGYVFGTSTLNSNGVATLVFPTKSIPAGTYSVLASFSPHSALDQASTSTPVTVTIQ